MSPSRADRLRMAALAVFGTLVLSSVCHAQGIYLTGVGPVNRSMGGAGTAAPLEAIGALYWNPGSISALPTNEVGFGMELVLIDASLATNVGGFTSNTSGEAGAVPIPSIGWVHHVEGTAVTIGLGIYGVGGFKNNLPVNPGNPLLANGPAYAGADILQIAPTIAYAVNEQLSIGVSPLITAATLMFDPLGPSVITPVPTPGQGNRLTWGGGFQAGVYYIPTDNWHFGFTYKSPQWFEDFRFFTPTGVSTFNLDLPMTLSLGTAYTGFECWTIAADVRYLNYADTPGFSELGWRNIWAAAIGAQYQMTDRMFVRMGYNFNQNPIQSSAVALNLLDPLIQDQNVSAGFSYRIASNVDLNAAYVYLVRNHVTGPLPSPPFPPGSTATHDLDAHSVVFGLTVRY